MDSMTVGGVSGGNIFVNGAGNIGFTLLNFGNLAILILLIIIYSNPTIIKDKGGSETYILGIVAGCAVVVSGMIASRNRFKTHRDAFSFYLN